MAKPIAAIVGRPNVGKSTLFNRLARERIAIVEGEPGITRDRLYADVEWLGHPFTVVDTGGIDTGTDNMTKQVRRQAEIAVEQADVVVFVVDGRDGLTGADEEVAVLLRKAAKPIILCINKIEDLQQGREAGWEFQRLGLGDPICVSAEHGRNIGDLLDQLVTHLPEPTEQASADLLHVAVVGRPNVGKSSLINRILGEERSIVSDVAGTTRDAIDTEFVRGQQRFLLIDTAGLRRRKKVEKQLEYYGVIRTLRAVQRSHVTVVVIDAVDGLTEQDKKIAGYAHENGRGIVLAVNKWDLVEKETNTMRDFERNIRAELQFLAYAPMVFLSALTGQRLSKLLDTVEMVAQQRALRIPTGQFNSLLQDAVALTPTPSDKGVRLRIYYGVQAQVNPPVFLLYVNRRDLMHFSYARYLENRIREEYGFVGTPIILSIKERSK